MSRLRRTTFRGEAKDDIARQALRTIIEVDAGRRTLKPLGSMAKTGDLTDCGRTYFGVDADADTHRIVFRRIAGRLEVVEVLEVVAVEERADDVVYLAAGLRLGRLEADPVRRSDAARKVHRARKRRGTR